MRGRDAGVHETAIRATPGSTQAVRRVVGVPVRAERDNRVVALDVREVGVWHRRIRQDDVDVARDAGLDERQTDAPGRSLGLVLDEQDTGS